MVEKLSVLSDYPAVLSEEFAAVDNDNACTTPIIADKDILEFVESSTNIMVVGSEGENEMNNAVLVLMSSEMQSILKCMNCYLYARPDVAMNNKVDGIKQFDAINSNAKKNIRLFSFKKKQTSNNLYLVFIKFL
ncbi:hypothetical protein TNCV_4237761 [Trichonephila clavipes]|nr:hypothetical protein TNCV_4237761 [Trichonephila clavipes]